MIFKKKESTQELLGIEAITDYGISTKQGELVFFSVAPTNLSVLAAMKPLMALRATARISPLPPA